MAKVDRLLAPTYRHLTVVYPFADVDAVIDQVFHRISEGEDLASGPSERAVVYRLARIIIDLGSDDPDRTRRRNAAASSLALRDAAARLTFPGRHQTERAIDALSTLSSDHQDALRLLLLGDVSLAELAWILDLDPDAAPTLVSHAFAALRDADRELDRIDHREDVDG